jgi:N6-adenosine-specific RNA methylase IME4
MLVKDLKKTNNIYQVIYADPPWNYRGQVQHGGADKGYTSGANAFYPTLTIADLCAMAPTIGKLADPEGCLLYLWYTPPILDDAVALTRAWGFKHATTAFVWVKKSDDKLIYDKDTGKLIEIRQGKFQVNPGHYTMSTCEMVNVSKKKKVPVPRGARNVRQVVFAPRTGHSEKPLDVRHRINQMHPLQKKIELFSRFDQAQPNPGNFDDWGMDLGSVPWTP